MKWVTRSHAKIDRLASAWLIARFVDPEAEFVFADGGHELATARALNGRTFDVKGGDVSDSDDKCTFELLFQEHRPNDPALSRLARIVHDADVAWNVSSAREAAGLRAVIFGLEMVHGANDQAKLEPARAIYDAIYEWCSRGGAAVIQTSRIDALGGS